MRSSFTSRWGDNSGNFGAYLKGCAGGFGTCADTGNGGGTLTMTLKFSPVSTTASSTLKVFFEDLDLMGAADPNGFVERLNVLNSKGQSLTGGWIKSLGPYVTGDHDHQTLALSLGILSADPLYLQLVFKSRADFYGTNTAEYLVAAVNWDDPPPGAGGEVPLPGAMVLMGTVLAGSIGVAVRRRCRLRAASPEILSAKGLWALTIDR